MGSRPSSFTLTTPGPLRLYSMLELLRLPPPSWLVKGILPAGGLVGLYGQPGHYKSFVAIDFAMSVATGLPWHGHEVAKGHTIYVAAEGGTGISKRGHAWLLEHNVDPRDADIAWLTESIPVSVDSENMEALFAKINDELYNKQPTLVVIDTLARCFDGDENQQEDMGRFIGGVDRLRREFDATVIVVHHTRLGADRERGSTAFRGAADTMVYVKKPRDREVEVLCDKQKDTTEFLTRNFELRTILLPPYPGVEEVLDSVVLVEPAMERSQQVLAFLAHGGMSFTDLKLAASDPTLGPPMSPSTLKRKLVSLVRSGEIVRENAIYRLKDVK